MNISFTLPLHAEILVKPKDRISFNDPLANVGTTEIQIVNLSEKIGINPQQIFKFLHKIIGEEVKAGDLVAEKKTFMTKRYFSDFDGKIKEINHNTGEISFEVVSENQRTITSPFKADIEDIEDSTLILKIDKGTAFPIKEGNYDGGGEVFYFKDEGQYFTITEEEIGNKMVMIKEIKNHIASKCEALGTSGFIFLKGDVQTDLPFIKLKNIEDFDKIADLQKKYSLFSVAEKKLVVYD